MTLRLHSVFLVSSVASRYVDYPDDILGLLTSFGSSSSGRFAVVESIHSRHLQNGIPVLVCQDCTNFVVEVVLGQAVQRKIERIRLGIARCLWLILALLFCCLNP